MKDIELIVKQFRYAVDAAKDKGEFENDEKFNIFPKGCCGDTSNLLAEFLLENDIVTEYVCGEFIYDSDKNNQTHAWLVVEKDIIIDITGDQFKYDGDFLNYDKSVYVGVEDDFHKLFKCIKRCEPSGLEELDADYKPNLKIIYEIISKYI